MGDLLKNVNTLSLDKILLKLSFSLTFSQKIVYSGSIVASVKGGGKVFLSTSEVCEAVGLSKAGLLKAMHSGRFPPGQRVGKTFVWPSDLVSRLGKWPKWQRKSPKGRNP